jgi:23S rRNA (cytosine1962-C5)-methyltransferase
MERKTLVTKPSAGYELLDCGGEEKLERFGDIVLARPDPQALWEKSLSHETWVKADGIYERKGENGVWEGKLPPDWLIEFGGLKFHVKPTSFKHVGLFPEQLSNWEWMQTMLTQNLRQQKSSAAPRLFADGGFAPSVLNLFAYTGGATLAAAQAGAEVCHVDASKTAVAWARENAEASGLAGAPIRWIVEDVMLFLRREIKRGKKYDAIIMDPPAFGHGPKRELWKIEENLLELMGLCKQLLSEKPLFVLINGYAAGYSPLAFAYNLENLVKDIGPSTSLGVNGLIEYGDLMIAQSGSDRMLPCGIFARWRSS